MEKVLGEPVIKGLWTWGRGLLIDQLAPYSNVEFPKLALKIKFVFGVEIPLERFPIDTDVNL
jgi:hypothetical protein